MGHDAWEHIAAAQHGMIARRQLREIGIDWVFVRTQLNARRWLERTPRVLSTFTGPLTPHAWRWLGVLHAGGDALIGGLSAAAVHGVKGWDREVVTVLVGDRDVLEPVVGIEFVRTRRSLLKMRDEFSRLPLSRIEPAALLYAGYTRMTSTALGLLSAVVQQRITTPPALAQCVGTMQPLRRSRLFYDALRDMLDGAESWNELRFGQLCARFGLAAPRRQIKRKSPSGHGYRTDAEWETADGIVVLEIDGPFHMEAQRWAADLARHRQLVTPGRIVIRCTTLELGRHPERVMADLRRLGVPRSQPHR